MGSPRRPNVGPADELAYFRRQSRISDPGPFASLYERLPRNLPGLCRVVQGLVIHYQDPALRRAHMPRRRLAEANTRYVDRMLARLRSLDERPLNDGRRPSSRIVGCCRDFALLFVSMARHQGIPARLRVGFANYFRGFPPAFWIDHTVAEVWSPGERRWRLVDPEQSPVLVRQNRIRFDPTDVPRDRFQVGGRAWLLCRNGEIEANKFCVLPGHEPSGFWFVRSRLLLDLAALNRTEVLLWDSWEATSPIARLDSRALDQLDRIAQNLIRDPPSVRQAWAAYRSHRWRVPREVWCYSPVARTRRERLRTTGR